MECGYAGMNLVWEFRNLISKLRWEGPRWAAMAKLLATQLLQQWKEALKTMPPGLTQAAKILVGEEITSNKVLITITLAWVLFIVARVCFGTRKNLPPGTHRFRDEMISTTPVASYSILKHLARATTWENWNQYPCDSSPVQLFLGGCLCLATCCNWLRRSRTAHSQHGLRNTDLFSPLKLVPSLKLLSTTPKSPRRYCSTWTFKPYDRRWQKNTESLWI